MTTLNNIFLRNDYVAVWNISVLSQQWTSKQFIILVLQKTINAY